MKKKLFSVENIHMGSTVRSSFWSGTQYAIKTFPEQRALAEQQGWKVDGQEEECPTTGRRHIQFWIKTPQLRRSQVSKIFQGAHLEPAKNVAALKNYCQKEETRVGNIPEASNKYPSQDKLFALFGGWIKQLTVSRNRWLYTDDGYRRKNVPGDVWLTHFDQCCGELIEVGYRVESLAVNPAVRSAIKKFGNAIFARYVNERDAEILSRRAADRQTDRHAEIFSETVIIPTIDGNTGEETEVDQGTDEGTSEGHDFEDDFSASTEGHTQSSDAHGSEAGDSQGDSE